MIAAILLAAGTSSRLGTPKQLLLHNGQPLLTVVVQNLLQSSVDQVVVVLGYRSAEMMRVLEGYPVIKVMNNDYRSGQSSSLKAGLAALDNSVKGALFALGDQPFVRPATIDLLVETYRATGGIVAPLYQGQRGNPVLFDALFFSEIQSLEGDIGAREVIQRYAKSLHGVDVSDAGVLVDIDTWEDVHSMLKENVEPVNFD